MRGRADEAIPSVDGKVRTVKGRAAPTGSPSLVLRWFPNIV